MDPNSSEGLRCLSKARESLFSADYVKSARLATKAARMLYSNSQAFEEANKVLQQAKDENPAFFKSYVLESHEGESMPDTSSKSCSKRKTDSSSNKKDESTDSSSILEKKCQNLLKAKDFYKVLDVPNDCSQEDIKKAYRKLALQLHPDKAKCPSAEAAFKEISKAYQCLSNTTTRGEYDRNGCKIPDSFEEVRRSEEFMTPEDLFASFFGFQMSQRDFHHSRVFRVHRTSGATYQDNRQGASFFQAIPFLILIALSILMNMPKSPEFPFSFNRTSEYNMARSTETNSIRYFVSKTFDKHYGTPEKIANIEAQVELLYFKADCHRMKQKVLRKLETVRYYGNARDYQKLSGELRNIEKTSEPCKKYAYFREAYPHLDQSIASY